MDSTECKVVRRLVEEVANGGRMMLIDELVAGDFREHAAAPGLPSDREVLKQDLASKQLFGNGSQYSISALTYQDGLVALTLEERDQEAEVICSGEHRIRVVEGKISEHWGIRPLFSTPRP